jgi:hypothetical protein
MHVETKFLRLFRAVELGDDIDGWRVCWLGGWDKGGVLFVVMAKRVTVMPRQEPAVLPALETAARSPVLTPTGVGTASEAEEPATAVPGGQQGREIRTTNEKPPALEPAAMIRRSAAWESIVAHSSRCSWRWRLPKRRPASSVSARSRTPAM